MPCFLRCTGDGKLHAYHFSRFPIADICAGTDQKALLRFGPNHLFQDAGRFTLSLHDENANRRTLSALLTFTAPPTDIVPDEDDGGADEHLWCPAAPACAVSGQITLRGRGDGAGERITFAGHGYHDHNRGALPFSRAVRDWYWARALLTDGTALIVYHVRHADGRPPVSHLLRFRDGKLLRHDARADVRLSRPLVNAFGRAYKTQLTVTSGDWNARFTLRGRLDSAPFYVRARVNVTLTENGKMQTGDGMGEWFCPHPLASALVASATKARIVEQEAPRPPIPGGQDAGRL